MERELFLYKILYRVVKRGFTKSLILRQVLRVGLFLKDGQKFSIRK